MMSASLTPPRLHTQLIRAALLVAAGLAALAAAAALGGAASAQQADACQSQVNRVNELKEMLATNPTARYHIDIAERAVRDCRDRVEAAKQERLASERSAAGNAYADATWGSQEQRDARDAWREADQATRGETRDADNYTPPRQHPGQPYNDGLSDWERYWCVQRDTTPSTDVNGNRIGGTNLQGTCP